MGGILPEQQGRNCSGKIREALATRRQAERSGQGATVKRPANSPHSMLHEAESAAGRQLNLLGPPPEPAAGRLCLATS